MYEDEEMDITNIEAELAPTKSTAKGERILRSERARSKRAFVKAVRETRILNDWARSRRLRKRSK